MFKNKIILKVCVTYFATILMFIMIIMVTQNNRVSSSPQRTFKVAIDAGHGGIDKGTYGKSGGVAESYVNLEIAKEIQSQLEGLGIETVMTRDGDYGLYGDCTPGFKKRDMEKRKEIIEDAMPDLVISIHCNYALSPTSSGLEVYYNSENSIGKIFAEKLQIEIQKIKTVTKCRLDTVKFYMTHVIPFPSVIIECGFLSNVNDEKLLTDKQYQVELSNRICIAVVETLSKTTGLFAI